MRLMAVFFVCFSLFVSSALASEIKVGVAGPMTGGLATFGEQIQHGTEIAVEEINQQGGLLGQKLSVITEDDACDPKQGRNVANKLVTEKVSVVFGHWCAASSMAASGVYGEEGILQIDPGALLEQLTHQGFSTIFRVSASTKGFADALGNYTAQHNPKANIAIIADQSAVTKELAGKLQTFFASTNNKIVAVEDIRGGDKDFSSVIDKLKALRPQVVICSCFTVEAGLLARQFADKNFGVYYYGVDTFNSPDFFNIIAGADTRKIVSVDYARVPQSAAYEKLADELHKRQWPIETTTMLTYAAFQVFAAAVKDAGSFETAKVVKALHGQTFPTIIGDVSFDEYGDRINPSFATYQWIGGKLKATGNLPH